MKPKQHATNRGRFPLPLEKRWKPGQSGNPKGRPKLILTLNERKARLSELARIGDNKSNPVEAIRELNRLDGAYPPERHSLEGFPIKIVFVPIYTREQAIEGMKVLESAKADLPMPVDRDKEIELG